MLNAIAPAVPELIGGSADLTGSNLTNIKGSAVFSASQRGGRNFHFGIREHAMGAVMNGMAKRPDQRTTVAAETLLAPSPPRKSPIP